jgi:hypothetical protein
MNWFGFFLFSVFLMLAFKLISYIFIFLQILIEGLMTILAWIFENINKWVDIKKA